jgi:hypothetical protein
MLLQARHSGGAVSNEYLDVYGEHAKVLRTWLVAYGIGAPVLLLTNESVSKAIKASGQGKVIAGCFLLGVALQVLLATFNKNSMWALYYGEENHSSKARSWYKLAYWFSESFWIDLLVDTGTLVLFALASWKGFGTLIQ